MAKEPTPFEIVENDIQRGVAYHKANVLSKLDVCEDYYRGNQWSSDDSEEYDNEIIDNMIFSTINSVIPLVSLNRPKIYVRPKMRKVKVGEKEIPGPEAASRMQLFANFLFDELRIGKTVDMCLHDAFIGFAGYAYIGFEPELNADGGPKSDNLIEMIENDEIFVDKLSHRDLIRDPDATSHDIAKDKWIAVRWTKTLQELQGNKLYKNTAGLEANVKAGGGDLNERTRNASITLEQVRQESAGNKVGGSKDKKLDLVEGYDYWNRITRKMYTIVEGHKKFLREQDWPIEYKGFPVEELWFNYNPNRPTPISDTLMVQTKQDFVNKFESKILDMVSRGGDSKFAFNSKLVNANKVRDWARSSGGAVIACKGNPNDAIKETDKITISRDLYQNVNLLKQDFLQSIGIASYEQGIGASLPTAKEGEIIDNATQPKKAYKAGKVEDFINRIVQKVVHVASEALEQTDEEFEIPIPDEAFEILGESYPSLLIQEDKTIYPFVAFNAQLFKSKYVFKIEAGSTQPVNSTTETEKALQLLTLSEKNPHIDPRAAIMIAMEKLDWLSYASVILKPKEAVAEEQKQAQQMAIEQAMAEPRLKTDVDLKKTLIKSLTSYKTALLQSKTKGVDNQVQMIEGDKNRDTQVVQALINALSQEEKGGKDES